MQIISEKLKLIKKGKVRDLYSSGDNILIVVSDRISAFDVVMDDLIPNKGIILNKISEFWFEKLSNISDNHLISNKIEDYLEPEVLNKYHDYLKGRSMVVKSCDVLPIEFIVRGYITGSGYKDYQSTGSICGIKLPVGLKESDKLPEPILTPSTKAEIGFHDKNINYTEAEKIIGKIKFEKIKEIAIELYKNAYSYSLERGIIIADTKFEFGIHEGKILLIDEVLTPDSSRFWSLNNYSPGEVQDSLDKQFLRNYLISIGFKKNPPAPKLPEDIINNTSNKYLEVYKILTGHDLIF